MIGYLEIKNMTDKELIIQQAVCDAMVASAPKFYNNIFYMQAYEYWLIRFGHIKLVN